MTMSLHLPAHYKLRQVAGRCDDHPQAERITLPAGSAMRRAHRAPATRR